MAQDRRSDYFNNRQLITWTRPVAAVSGCGCRRRREYRVCRSSVLSTVSIRVTSFIDLLAGQSPLIRDRNSYQIIGLFKSMGILHGLMGNASPVEIQALETDLDFLIAHGEEIVRAYKLIRDIYILTNKRLIFVDFQGVTGKKREYRSIPYKSITQFSVETAGHFDLDAELKIWISGSSQPIEKKFSKKSNINDMLNILSYFVMG